MMEAENNRFTFLLEEFLAGRISADEMSELERLVGEDARRKALFEACSGPKPVSTSATLSAFERHWKLVDAPTSRMRRSLANWKIAVAAAVLIMAVGIVGYQRFGGDVLRHYATELGQRKQFILPDGTTVWLNGGSTLTLDRDFNSGARRVIFRGEGLFDIHKDPAKPFVVDVGEAAVTVLGTVFNLRAYEGEERLETTLLSGKVALTLATDPEHRLMLDPGKKLVVYRTNRLDNDNDVPASDAIAPQVEGRQHAVLSDARIDENEQVANDVLWTSDKLVFDGDNLDLVASKLTKWYGVEVRLATDAHQDLKFSGIFQDMALDSVLQTLAYTGSLRFERDGKAVVLQGLGGSPKN